MRGTTKNALIRFYGNSRSDLSLLADSIAATDACLTHTLKFRNKLTSQPRCLPEYRAAVWNTRPASQPRYPKTCITAAIDPRTSWPILCIFESHLLQELAFSLKIPGLPLLSRLVSDRQLVPYWNNNPCYNLYQSLHRQSPSLTEPFTGLQFAVKQKPLLHVTTVSAV